MKRIGLGIAILLFAIVLQIATGSITVGIGVVGLIMAIAGFAGKDE